MQLKFDDGHFLQEDPLPVNLFFKPFFPFISGMNVDEKSFSGLRELFVRESRPLRGGVPRTISMWLFVASKKVGYKTVVETLKQAKKKPVGLIQLLAFHESYSVMDIAGSNNAILFALGVKYCIKNSQTSVFLSERIVTGYRFRKIGLSPRHEGYEQGSFFLATSLDT